MIKNDTQQNLKKKESKKSICIENESQNKDNKAKNNKNSKYKKENIYKKNKKLILKNNNESKNSMEYLIGNINNDNSYKLNKSNKLNIKEKIFKYNKKEKIIVKKKNNALNSNYNNDEDDINITKFLEPSFQEIDYDDVIEEDKRTFCQYYCEKIKKNQKIINLFISEILKPKSIKLIVFILNMNLYFLINGLFYNDSYK
jgi:hypothetical protein